MKFKFFRGYVENEKFHFFRGFRNITQNTYYENPVNPEFYGEIRGIDAFWEAELTALLEVYTETDFPWSGISYKNKFKFFKGYGI